MQTVNKKIDCEIELGGGVFITHADVEFVIEFESDGGIGCCYPTWCGDIWITGDSGTEHLADAKNWDLEGMKADIFGSVDWDAKAELYVDYSAWMDEERSRWEEADYEWHKQN